jgi:hypothetical protein
MNTSRAAEKRNLTKCNYMLVSHFYGHSSMCCVTASVISFEQWIAPKDGAVKEGIIDDR